MKMNRLQVHMRVDPKQSTTADLDIFEDIDEWEGWDGSTRGMGPKTISEFLAEHSDIDNIHVRISSNGGDVFEGIAIHNLLKSSGKKIDVEVVGLAASIASVIAMAGDTITMHPTSMMMIHNCWTWACGNANEFRKLADQMDQIMESSKTAYLEKAGDKLSAEVLDEMLDAETYLSADQCFELGLCDEIVGKDADTESEGQTEAKAEEKVRAEKAAEIDMKKSSLNWLFC